MKCLNRDQLKYLAAAAMVFNHIAHLFLDPHTMLHFVFLHIGLITAPIMLWLLVEGHAHTSDKEKYRKRLLVGGLVSELPYTLVVCASRRMPLTFAGMDILITLYLCFRIVENRRNDGDLSEVIGLILVSILCDWYISLPVFTLFFLRMEKKRAFLASAVFFALIQHFTQYGPLSWSHSVLFAMADMASILAAGFLICVLYNGKQYTTNRTFHKWFFYVFYPLHFMILWGIWLIVNHIV